MEVFRTYVEPLIRSEVRQACISDSNETLTLHIRNGDVALDTKTLHQQPPCRYYYSIIENGNNGKAFNDIQLIYSRDAVVSPCIAQIKHRYPKAKIKYPGTLESDACKLMKAKNLAVTTSAFSAAFKLLNTDIQRLFYFNPFQCSWTTGLMETKTDVHCRYYDLNLTEACQAFPKASVMQFRYVSANHTLKHAISRPKAAKRIETANYFNGRDGGHLSRSACIR